MNAEQWVLRQGKDVSCLIARRPVQRPARSAEQSSAARADLRLPRAAETNDAASSKGVNWTGRGEGPHAIKRLVSDQALHFRLWHKADIPLRSTNVRFWGNSGQSSSRSSLSAFDPKRK